VARIGAMGETLPMANPVTLMPRLLALIDQAAAVVMGVYDQDFAVVEKADSSPVTEADEAAEAVILAGLHELTPDIPVIAEEAVSAGRVPAIGEDRFWLVDPLDGTKEFVSRNGEFTVNIALVEGERPILGLVAAPARGVVWTGMVGEGAARHEKGESRPIHVRPRPARHPIAVASRSHRDAETDAWLAANGVTETISAGSSLKFCLVAEGRADLYPRFGPTMEWDTAAGDAVLRSAGGRVLTLDGAPFPYRKPGFRNPGFIAQN
jgi:3'(2'), 5'-bisphosphate nucleotidase